MAHNSEYQHLDESAAAARIERDPAAADGHDHVALMVDRPVRDALIGHLFQPQFRGVGYTEFLRRAIAAGDALANPPEQPIV